MFHRYFAYTLLIEIVGWGCVNKLVSGHCNGRHNKHETTIEKKMILLKNRNQRFVKLKEVQASPQADTIAPHLILPNAPKTHRHGNN